MQVDLLDHIAFTVNGIPCIVGGEVTSNETLLDYIRNTLEFRGTKYMCREGGCGNCIVNVVRRPGYPEEAVNSCLVSVTSCHEWDVTTIEKLGNRKDGYHILQETLANFNGTQCGHCSPGWIMAMHGFLKSNPKPTMLDIENAFGSNICRCTGYRPIMAAFTKFAVDAPEGLTLPDIEDLEKCQKTGKFCDKRNSCEYSDWCIVSKYEAELPIKLIKLTDDRNWFKVYTIDQIFQIFSEGGTTATYMLVAGNTAKGAVPITSYPKNLIDISDVDDLKHEELDQNLVVATTTTLTSFIELCNRYAKEDENFSYLSKIATHIEKIAHIAVRNIGTIAGNLMIKHHDNNFPSDVFLLFETVGAQLVIHTGPTSNKTVNMQEFLKMDMNGCIISKVMLPPLNPNEYKLVTFKIMPRAQSAHAIVNAGFLFELDNLEKVLSVRMVYGGLSKVFIRATSTEAALVGKPLFKNETLQTGISELKSELVVPESPPEMSAAYRKHLAICLFYKALLILCPTTKLGNKYHSGAIKIHDSRGVSTGTQTFDTKKLLWPLTEPINKIDALIQCAGEAQYTEDIPAYPHEVFSSFVLTTVAKGKIKSIDPSEALAQQGVVAFYSKDDIPGENVSTPFGIILFPTDEVLFVGDEIEYYNQPLGIIVAESREMADIAAKLVKVTYTDVKPAVLDLNVAKDDPDRRHVLVVLDPKPDDKNIEVYKGKQVKGLLPKVIKGSNTIYGQYHFSMETVVSIARPTEEGIESHAATQWIDGVQVATAKALNMDANKIDVYVRRLGGAFGIKISRTFMFAVACNMVVKKLNRPCRMIGSMNTVMRATGKRHPCITEYTITVAGDGAIILMDYHLYSDCGYVKNEPVLLLGVPLYSSVYKPLNIKFTAYEVLTDNPKNTFCRSPGTLECVNNIEWIMERISYETNNDPIDVRLKNLNILLHSDIIQMYKDLRDLADYDARRAKVDLFNSENRWKKCGLRFAFLRWEPLGPFYMDVNMSVSHHDGTVTITHGGVEMGQGVNTKAVQVAAYLLNIPISKIQIKPNSTTMNPNGFLSGGSVTSQNINIGIQRCCEELLLRLAPIKLALVNPPWEKLIKAAFVANVDLQTHGFVSLIENIINATVYGVALSEVEVDILTGESEIRRVDILQDVGQSISPQVDIGQVEGAFVMGQGYWTCERLVYDQATGELLTDRTFTYYVPQCRDIPEIFNVHFKKNSYSDIKMFGAKTIGEPPLNLAISIPFAIRECIVSARKDAGYAPDKWFNINGPYTTEKICMAAETDTDDFRLY